MPSATVGVTIYCYHCECFYNNNNYLAEDLSWIVEGSVMGHKNWRNNKQLVHVNVRSPDSAFICCDFPPFFSRDIFGTFKQLTIKLFLHRKVSRVLSTNAQYHPSVRTWHCSS